MVLPSAAIPPVKVTCAPAWAPRPAKAWLAIWNTLPPLKRTSFAPAFVQAGVQ